MCQALLILGMQQWTKTTKILLLGCLHGSESHPNRPLHWFKQ